MRTRGRDSRCVASGYGPEYNKENYKNFLEWRFMYPREEIKEDVEAGVYVVNNDNFDAVEKLGKLFLG